MTDVKVDGWDLEYKNVKARFRFCRNENCYIAYFIMNGLDFTLKETGYDKFIEKFKKFIDSLT